MTARRLAPAIALVLLACLTPSKADAYCQTSVCDGDKVGFICDPPTSVDCGVALFWPGGCTGFSIQREASSQVDYETARSLTEQAFATWSNADCGNGTPPMLSVESHGAVSCDAVEFNAEDGNANTIIFRDEEWPYAGGNTLALTTVTFNLETGEIRDADMELNSANVAFTTSDDDVKVDLLSVLTHETGHFLGLSHSPAEPATMNADYTPKTIGLRDLDEDDVGAICATYGTVSGACDSAPKNGFSEECHSEAADDGCCSVSPIGSSRGDQLWRFALLALGMAALGMRRRRIGVRRTAR